MTTMTRRQVIWLAFFCGIFFTTTSVIQYFFVKNQVKRTVLAELRLLAYQINKTLDYDYNEGIDIIKINKASIEAQRYYVILDNGRILDTGSYGIVPKLIPKVVFLGSAETIYKHPINFTDETGEKWRLFGKRLQGGKIFLGITTLAKVSSPDVFLINNSKYFGVTLKDAEAVNNSVIDNNVDYAVIDDYGNLIAATGRIPLRIESKFAQNVKESHVQTRIDGKDYLVLYTPFLDKTKKTVGLIIIPQDITLAQFSLNEQILFNVTVASISSIILFAVALRYWSKKEIEKRRLKEAFQNYFSPQIMEAILKDPSNLKLGGQRQEVTILFADIRSFTTLSEKLYPEQLTYLLQEYFTEMTDAILATDGIVDKYIGDAIMAFWGAPIKQPDQADRVVTAAVDMIRRLKKLQNKWLAEGYPYIDAGIGINTGIATVGNMGSNKRFDYTVIGDAVNVAARIEGLNKTYGSNIIISESTKNKLTISVSTRDLGEITVKGKATPIKVYKIEES